MEKKLPFFLLVLLILLFQTTISVESVDPSPALLKYVLQWPPTFCFDLHSKKEGRCKVPIPDYKFTLHGLMQANATGFNINCSKPIPPDSNDLIELIEDKLEPFWPSLRVDFSQRDFWMHEWQAHGSCGGTTPVQYFSTAIKINKLPKDGNLFNYFIASEIFPSYEHGYTKKSIVKAIQTLVDERRPPILPPPPPLNVYVSCSVIDSDAGIYFLSEVTLCTNLYGDEFISCPSEADPKSCPDDNLIMLPLPIYHQLDLPLNIWKKPM